MRFVACLQHNKMDAIERSKNVSSCTPKEPGVMSSLFQMSVPSVDMYNMIRPTLREHANKTAVVSKTTTQLLLSCWLCHAMCKTKVSFHRKPIDYCEDIKELIFTKFIWLKESRKNQSILEEVRDYYWRTYNDGNYIFSVTRWELTVLHGWVSGKKRRPRRRGYRRMAWINCRWWNAAEWHMTDLCGEWDNIVFTYSSN